MLRRVARSSVVPSSSSGPLLLVVPSMRHGGDIGAHFDPLPHRNPPAKSNVKGMRAATLKGVDKDPINFWSWRTVTSDQTIAVPIPEETKKEFANQMIPKRDENNSVKAANLLEKARSEKIVKERTWMEHKKGIPTPTNPTQVPFVDAIVVQEFWESYVLPLRAQANVNPLGYTPMCPPYMESKRPKAAAEVVEEGAAAKKKEVTS